MPCPPPERGDTSAPLPPSRILVFAKRWALPALLRARWRPRRCCCCCCPHRHPLDEWAPPRYCWSHYSACLESGCWSGRAGGCAVPCPRRRRRRPPTLWPKSFYFDQAVASGAPASRPPYRRVDARRARHAVQSAQRTRSAVPKTVAREGDNLPDLPRREVRRGSQSLLGTFSTGSCKFDKSKFATPCLTHGLTHGLTTCTAHNARIF